MNVWSGFISNFLIMPGTKTKGILPNNIEQELKKMAKAYITDLVLPYFLPSMNRAHYFESELIKY
jgi:hypothetical protein